MKRSIGALIAVFMLAAMTACSSSDQSAEQKEEAKPLDAKTGREAFQSMYVAARGWKQDAMPLQLKNIPLAQVTAGPGKSGAWQAIFVSPSAGRARTFTWCAIEMEGNLHKGVFGTPDERWSGPSGDTVPFTAIALKVDTDDALKTALAKSEDYVKKHPNAQVIFLLEQNHRFADLSWRILWGESIATSDYSVFVDATTGELLAKEKG
jgi:hypothetical protein